MNKSRNYTRSNHYNALVLYRTWIHNSNKSTSRRDINSKQAGYSWKHSNIDLSKMNLYHKLKVKESFSNDINLEKMRNTKLSSI